MPGHWKPICKIKEIPLMGARVVQRGLAWQELPGVAVFRTADDAVYALLDRCPCDGALLSRGLVAGEKLMCAYHEGLIDLASGATGGVKRFTVKIDDGRVYLDIDELSAPASRAEAALAGAFGVATHIAA
ncbi:MAG: Rieske 2Fe-2S domain-containing protein [Massilia sp.]